MACMHACFISLSTKPYITLAYDGSLCYKPYKTNSQPNNNVTDIHILGRCYSIGS